MNTIWHPIISYEGLYEISNYGEVKSTIFPIHKIRKPVKHKQGYLVAVLSKNSIRKIHYIHRLVAQAFIPNPESKQFVNHKNGIKDDNTVFNLEWCTRVENEHHARDTGLKVMDYKGEGNPFSVLDNARVLAIRREYETGQITMRPLARKYNVTQPTVYKIINRITWGHLW